MARIGGKARADIFRINSAHTAIYSGTSGTTAATGVASAALTLGGSITGNDILEQTDFTYNDDGSVSIKFAQTKYDAAYQAALDVFCPRTAAAATATATEEKTDETGRKIGGAGAVSTTQQQVLLNSYGANGDDTKIPLGTYLGYFKQTSGAKSQKGGSWVAPGLEFQSVAALTALAVPSALLDATIVTAATVTMATGSFEKVSFLTPA